MAKAPKSGEDILAHSVLTQNMPPLASQGSQIIINLALAMLFMGVVGVVTYIYFEQTPGLVFLVTAAVVGSYMALNIGANDVANNVGPAVGSGALTMGGALIIAATFEAAGAILAGGDVVSTISKGIVDPSMIATVDSFIWIMISALAAGALWINLATWVGAPVSTTHSIVGGVLGAGAAAAGLNVINWPTMGAIAASWVISPVLGGLIAATFLYFIKTKILYQEDKIAAARRWVPVMLAIMAAAFGVYLAIKGLKRVWKPELEMVALVGLVSAVMTYLLTRPVVHKASTGLENRKKSVHKLFTIPLIFAAALLSFAHGANDVANAVGPLAAVVAAVGEGGIAAKVAIPIWVMVLGAVGLSIGLLLFGPKLIKTVGQEITRLNPTRAFCVALSAAITVIAASWLGLPVSSTHIAVGGVFGVGFLREGLAHRKRQSMGLMIDMENPDDPKLSDKLRGKIAKRLKRRLVRRSHMLRIAGAWVITVPSSAAIAAGIYFIMAP